MIRKSGFRISEKIMLQLREFMRKAIGAVEIRLAERVRQRPTGLVAICLLDDGRQSKSRAMRQIKLLKTQAGA